MNLRFIVCGVIGNLNVNVASTLCRKNIICPKVSLFRGTVRRNHYPPLLRLLPYAWQTSVTYSQTPWSLGQYTNSCECSTVNHIDPMVVVALRKNATEVQEQWIKYGEVDAGGRRRDWSEGFLHTVQSQHRRCFPVWYKLNESVVSNAAHTFFESHEYGIAYLYYLLWTMKLLYPCRWLFSCVSLRCIWHSCV